VAAHVEVARDYRTLFSRSAKGLGTMVQEDCRMVTLESAASQTAADAQESAGATRQSQQYDYEPLVSADGRGYPTSSSRPLKAPGRMATEGCHEMMGMALAAPQVVIPKPAGMTQWNQQHDCELPVAAPAPV
jgi:hypothetical protein